MKVPQELRVTCDGVTLDGQELLVSGDHPIRVRSRPDVDGVSLVTLTLLVDSVTVVEGSGIHTEPTEDGLVVTDAR